MVDTKTSNPQKTEENQIYPRQEEMFLATVKGKETCLLYTSPSPRDRQKSRMPSSA